MNLNAHTVLRDARRTYVFLLTTIPAHQFSHIFFFNAIKLSWLLVEFYLVLNLFAFFLEALAVRKVVVTRLLYKNSIIMPNSIYFETYVSSITQLQVKIQDDYKRTHMEKKTRHQKKKLSCKRNKVIPEL